MDNFEKWLCREMPAGTVIGNPSWWAPRIMKAAQAEAQQTIAAQQQQIAVYREARKHHNLKDALRALLIKQPNMPKKGE